MGNSFTSSFETALFTWFNPLGPGVHNFYSQYHLIYPQYYPSICLSLCRSSRLEMFFKRGVFVVFIAKHLCWSIFLIKFRTEGVFQHRCFSMNIAKFLRTAFLRTPLVTVYDHVLRSIISSLRSYRKNLTSSQVNMILFSLKSSVKIHLKLQWLPSLKKILDS